jgi:transposase
MHNENSYFGTQNGSLAICHFWVVTIEQYELAQSSYNMASPMPTCTVEEQRNLIHFLWSEGVKPSEIYGRIKVQYGDSCLSQGRVYEWVERFQNGRQKISDKHHRGSPVCVATETVKQQIWQRIRDYRRVTIDEIALAFNMSHSSAYNIGHNNLGYRKVCSRWVPRQLSDDHKLHGRRFVRSIWTVMLMNEMLFSIEL